ncbi:sigma-70 family RNA polymerase sigma factor [Ahrensia sp. R2A130]|uniref:sigma-70 family RNA polymerase sigma factor n=1 Tax=Ahrensia sp. R2A130 TaxID=744979 RepID=UPI0001E09C58|nr:sigma-70 family RNA polymerase sigma factor [Ahrensia sp. R2A130]EFL88579.1 RNA polymerase sigma factor SigK [Ahrensia sp. R2A130]
MKSEASPMVAQKTAGRAGDEVTLESLMAATAAGDRAAFRTLYERTSAKLFGVVLRILRNRSKAEDALQDVYVKIWQKAGQYDSKQGRPITWMATVARNRAIDIVRATRPEQTVDEPGDEEEIFRLGGSANEQVDVTELETLRTCLSEMKEDDRNYVLLAYYEGWSRDELAERFAIPSGTVKTRLRRGLIQLRTCLEN